MSHFTRTTVLKFLTNAILSMKATRWEAGVSRKRFELARQEPLAHEPFPKSIFQISLGIYCGDDETLD